MNEVLVMKLSHVMLVGLGCTALGVAACDQTESPVAEAAPEVAKQPSQDAAVALYRTAECGPEKPPTGPTAGETFDYLMLGPDGSLDRMFTRRQTIRAVSGDLIDYTESLIRTGADAFPPEQRRVQLRVLPTMILGAAVRYESARTAMEGLGVGQTATLPMTATRPDHPPKEAEASLTFVGCGVSEPIVEGAAGEPVRIYRVKLPYSTPAEPDALTRSIDTEFLVSQSRGWPIAERTPSGTLVLVSPPE